MFSLLSQPLPSTSDRASSVAASRAQPSPRPKSGAQVETRRAMRDDARLALMVREHHRVIWRVARRLGVPQSHCDDAVQHVFMIAADRLDDVKIGSERSFLIGTAIRVAANARRLAHVRREQGEDDTSLHVDPAPNAEALVDQKRMRELLDEVLDALDDDLREVLVLHELEGLPAPAIAELLSLPVGTVASRLRRAREEFQSCARRVRARAAHRGGA